MDELTKRRITQRVKEAREQAGISQEEMASLLGLTQRAYQWYESQKDPRPPLRRLKEIAEITGVSQEWLLRGDELARDGLEGRLARIESHLERLAEMVTLLNETVAGQLEQPEVAGRTSQERPRRGRRRVM